MKYSFYLFSLSLIFFFTHRINGQSSIYVAYEKLDPGPSTPNSRPCYIAELDVKTCNLKKIIDLDSLNIRFIREIVLNKERSKMFVYSDEFLKPVFNISLLNLEDKNIDSVLKINFQTPGFAGHSFMLHHGRKPNHLFLTKSNLFSTNDTLIELNYNTKKMSKVWFGESFAFQGNYIWYKGKFLIRSGSASAKPGLYQTDFSKDNVNTLIADSTGISKAIEFYICNASPTCDTTILYGLNPLEHSLYRFDIETQSSKKICSNPLLSYVKAIESPYDHLSSNCSPFIDLTTTTVATRPKTTIAVLLSAMPKHLFH